MFKHDKDVKNRLYNTLIDWVNVGFLLGSFVVFNVTCHYFNINLNFFQSFVHILQTFL